LALANYLHFCASVTKQYNLVPANGVISLAGKAEMLASRPGLGLQAVQDHFLEILVLVLVLNGGLG